MNGLAPCSPIGPTVSRPSEIFVSFDPSHDPIPSLGFVQLNPSSDSA